MAEMAEMAKAPAFIPGQMWPGQKQIWGEWLEKCGGETNLRSMMNHEEGRLIKRNDKESQRMIKVDKEWLASCKISPINRNESLDRGKSGSTRCPDLTPMRWPEHPGSCEDVGDTQRFCKESVRNDKESLQKRNHWRRDVFYMYVYSSQ